MPALPVIANVIRCSVRGTLPSGREWVNVIHILKPNATSIPVAIAAIDTLLLNLYTVDHAGGGFRIMSMVHTTGTLDAIDYLPLDGTTATTTVVHAAVGAGATDSLPAQTSLVVTAQTGLRGRRHRGRTFLPPFCEGNSDANGNPTAAATAGLQVQWNGFLADAITAVMFPVVASYRFADENHVTGYVVRSKWATRRKRQGRQP